MLLKRFLEHEGYAVDLVANITDINDKIYTAATKAGVRSDDLAKEMVQSYLTQTDRLGLGRPDHEPLASETLGPIIELIQTLIDRDHAYEVDGDVYFRVRSLPSYGELSHREIEKMDQGEGVEGAERKQDPLDFALWKAQKPDEDTAWDSPWGKGRPGWHIECSAMAEQLLGLEFDIHGGGTDLLFPHHENEAAQTYAARGRELAKIWMHNGMIELGGGSNGEDSEAAEKMSKSLGNIRGLREVLDEVGRDALVMYFCSGRYRQPLAFSRERLEGAASSVSRIKEVARRVQPGESPLELLPLKEAFFDSLANDYNTPEALASLFDWVTQVNKLPEGVGDSHLREMLYVFGLENLLEAEAGAPSEIVELAQRRYDARAGRDFAEADRLRDELAQLGWEARDKPDGFELIRIES
jgi:cysteinyl-tRNA synthetase